MGAGVYAVRFRDSRPVAPGVAAFVFARPKGYDFLPGQSLSLTLSTREGEHTKHFSHCSSPQDPNLEIATRLSGSAFKDALLALSPADEVVLSGPKGALTLEPGDRRVAFLIGGVGITPARSIIRDAVQRDTGLQVSLFYGNQDESAIAFGPELAGYAATHEGIRVIDVLAAPGEGWPGERGFITADLVRRHIDPGDGWRFMIVGPPAMVSAMEGVVAQLRLPPPRVSFERFAGYADG